MLLHYLRDQPEPSSAVPRFRPALWAGVHKQSRSYTYLDPQPQIRFLICPDIGKRHLTE